MVFAHDQAVEITQKARQKNIDKGIGNVMKADGISDNVPDYMKTKLIAVNSKVLIFFEKCVYDIAQRVKKQISR